MQERVSCRSRFVAETELCLNFSPFLFHFISQTEEEKKISKENGRWTNFGDKERFHFGLGHRLAPFIDWISIGFYFCMRCKHAKDMNTLESWNCSQSSMDTKWETSRFTSHLHLTCMLTSTQTTLFPIFIGVCWNFRFNAHDNFS